MLHVCVSASACVMRPGREWACRLASQQSGQSWAYGASALGQQVFFRVCSLLLCLIFPYFLALQQQRPICAARPTVYTQMEYHCCQMQTCSLKCPKTVLFLPHTFITLPYNSTTHRKFSIVAGLHQSRLEFLKKYLKYLQI